MRPRSWGAPFDLLKAIPSILGWRSTGNDGSALGDVSMMIDVSAAVSACGFTTVANAADALEADDVPSYSHPRSEPRESVCLKSFSWYYLVAPKQQRS